MTFDFKQFEIPTESIPVVKPKAKSAEERMLILKYIKGPLPISWLVRASEQPGKYTLLTALAIFYARGFEFGKEKHLVMERYYFDQLGVKKDSTRRALARLDKAGLIALSRKGRKFVVTILPVPTLDDNGDEE
jgi:hypothetical protein